MDRLKAVQNQPGTYLAHCPGCEQFHAIPTGEGVGPRWEFNGNIKRPSFNPSLLVRGVDDKGRDRVCHSFIVNGIWQFLPDCTHKLAGQNIPLATVKSTPALVPHK